MDGKGRWLDNVFVERLWRSVKYEEVYLHAYADVAEARGGIGDYLHFFNEERPHQALGNRTPSEIYFASLMESEHCRGRGFTEMSRPTGNSQQSTAIHRLSVSPRAPLDTDYGGEEWTLSP